MPLAAAGSPARLDMHGGTRASVTGGSLVGRCDGVDRGRYDLRTVYRGCAGDHRPCGCGARPLAAQRPACHGQQQPEEQHDNVPPLPTADHHWLRLPFPQALTRDIEPTCETGRDGKASDQVAGTASGVWNLAWRTMA